ncbi:MAG TPA: hypothetical protein VD908_19390, partial [Cytophagales bacterium]|nr:hypothetical protein [Cytophagales bacterium]
MRREDKDLDQIIFEYIEGELPLEDKEVFELRLLKDDEIKEQVELWKVTIISEGFSYTSELEQKLFVKSRRQWWNLSLNSILFVSFLLFIIHATLKEPELSEVGVEKRSFFQEKILRDESKLGFNKKEIYKYENTGIVETPQEVLFDTIQVCYEEKVENKTLHEVQKKGLVIGATIFLTNTYPVKRMKIKKAKRTLTRKEVRAGNRKTRKDTERRIANQFRKGNVPYVVPLDVSNF